MSYSKTVGLIPLNMEVSYQRGGSASLYPCITYPLATTAVTGLTVTTFHTDVGGRDSNSVPLHFHSKSSYPLKQLQENLVVSLCTAYKRIGESQISDSSTQDQAETSPPL